jgi:hypothetical protein
MLTDSPRRRNRAGFLQSDAIKTLDLPPNGDLFDVAKRQKADSIRDIRSTCSEFLRNASDFYKFPACAIRVLAARPLRVRERGTFELFGD